LDLAVALAPSISLPARMTISGGAVEASFSACAAPLQTRTAHVQKTLSDHRKIVLLIDPPLSRERSLRLTPEIC
jgi:hypothetical protein